VKCKCLKERDLGIDGRIILKWICKFRHASMDWIHVTQDSNWFCTLVNTVMNLQVP
jgi:hypothetical protein